MIDKTGVVHFLKTWRKPFASVVAGDKPYEIRTDDRNYQPGDVLVLREWVHEDDSSSNGHYSGLFVSRLVTYKTSGGSWGLPEGLCVLGMTPCDPPCDARYFIEGSTSNIDDHVRAARAAAVSTSKALRRVVLESPYAGDVTTNLRYARAAIRDSLARGEAPIASHLLYTQEGILDDDKPTERAWGIEAGLAWCEVSDATVVYIDLGISRGMLQGIDRAKRAGRPVEMRKIPDWEIAAVLRRITP